MDDRFYTIFLDFSTKINNLIMQFELISGALTKIENNEIKTIEYNAETIKEITSQNSELKENIKELEAEFTNLTKIVCSEIQKIWQECEKCEIVNGYKALTKKLWSICIFLFVILLCVLGLNLFNIVKLPGLIK